MFIVCSVCVWPPGGGPHSERLSNKMMWLGLCLVSWESPYDCHLGLLASLFCSWLTV